MPVIQDCHVPQAPPPIPDCPSLTIPVEPPVTAIPCPQINFSASSAGSLGLIPIIKVDVAPPPAAGAEDDCGDPVCNYQTHFQFQVDPEALIQFIQTVVVDGSCPTIHAQAQVQTQMLQVGANPHVGVKVIASQTMQGCEYDFVFQYQFPQVCNPCPGNASNITPSSVQVDNCGLIAGEVVTINGLQGTVHGPKNANHTWTINFTPGTNDPHGDGSFIVPSGPVNLCGGPCPQLSATATATSLPPVMPSSKPQVYVDVQKVGSCQDIFHFQFQNQSLDTTTYSVPTAFTVTCNDDGTFTVTVTASKNLYGPPGQ